MKIDQIMIDSVETFEELAEVGLSIIKEMSLSG